MPSGTDHRASERARPLPGVVAAVPARYASTRLPGKPLLEIAGRPMIEHVVRRAEEAGVFERVVVLTDDQRIADAVEAFGGHVEMTPADCASGTDRIAHAARAWSDAHVIVNVQGDEPLVDPSALARVARALVDDPQLAMATLAAPLDRSEHERPSTVKVVCDLAGDALYFSRAPIPHARDGWPAADDGSSSPTARGPLQHVGVYSYRRDILLRLAALEPTPLERLESLEQLRALENGIGIRVLRLARPAAPGVDTPDDLERVAERLARADSA
ncbi:MAG: 3-deoxy-manno-octulosonate cytidylyltransferase [Acidobacteriota bacterium]